MFLSAAALLAAMAATGGTRPARVPTPNYVAKLEHKVAWPSFPLRVYFTRDSEHTPERERHAISGFRQWDAATGGLNAFRLTDRASRADVTVRLDPGTNDGSTTNSFSRGEMIRSEMRIGVKRDRGGDIACIAAHEFGHVLGLTGHSDDRKDLMYAYHWMGKGCGISERDLNTLASRYPGLTVRLEAKAAEAVR